MEAKKVKKLPAEAGKTKNITTEVKTKKAEADKKRYASMSDKDKQLLAKVKAEARDEEKRAKFCKDPLYKVVNAGTDDDLQYDSENLNFLIDMELLRKSIETLEKMGKQ